MHCPVCHSQDVLVDESGVFECQESLSGCGWLRGDVSALYSIPGELIKRIQAVRGGYSFREYILVAIEEKLERDPLDGLVED